MNRNFWLLALLTPFLVPVLVFLASGLSVGMSLPDAATALVEQCAQRKQNPLITGILGLVPIGALAVV
ncbi:hypothetical protein K8I85_03185, partial [bacterium]|nr:hypothetical protein [bacterium]